MQFFTLFSILFLFLFSSCEAQVKEPSKYNEPNEVQIQEDEELNQEYTQFPQKLAQKAYTLTKDQVTYDPTYFSIPYPNGDVPEGKGVCTDVVIRAYRKMGIDLQKEVHEDMKANFGKYPKIWGLKTTDKNIDHRRVPNLQVFFTRKGEKLPITENAKDYQPGDLVTWKLGGRLPHIGIVSNLRNNDDSRYLIIHNVGAGQVVQDFLFDSEIDGHYRYKK